MKNGLLKTLSFLCLFSITACSNVNNEQSSINKISSSIHDVITTSNIESSSSLDKTISSEEVSSSSIHVHTPSEKVIENKIEATCLDEGSYDEVIYCSSCKEELSREHKIIEALGHDYSSWVTIIEANENQDGKRKKECSRCHDIVEEIVPTTSQFSYKLNNDQSSYTIDGYNVNKETYVPYNIKGLYNASYTQGASLIEIPETFNNLPITNIELSFTLLKDEPIPVICISKNVKINCLRINKYQDFIKENPVFNNLRSREVLINIYYKGSISDWLNNAPIDKKTDVDLNMSLYKLFFYDTNLETFSQEDTLNIPEGVESIEDYAFSHVQFTKLVCPSTLKTIGSSSFYANHKLHDVILNEGLTKIKSLAFNLCQDLKSLTLPSSIIDISAGAITDDLFEITVKKGASGYIDSLKSIPYLIKIIDENENTSYIDENRYITKNNIENSEVFNYQGFKVLKINNKFELLGYQFNENDDDTLNLPEKIMYQNQEVSQYGVHCYFVSQSVPLGLSFDEIINAYQNIQEMRKYYCYPKDLFFKLHIPHTVTSIDAYAFINVQFIQEIYYDGTYLEWQNLLKKQSGSLSNFVLAQTQVVHVKNENGSYVEMPIYS